jgi:hypothetical protein
MRPLVPSLTREHLKVYDELIEMKVERFAISTIVPAQHQNRSSNMNCKLPMKSTIAASFLAVSMLGAPNVAEAKTKIGIYFGVPFYDTAVDDGYLYEPDYGWYAPEYRYSVRRNNGYARVSCNQAARQLRKAGYRYVVAIECSGRNYEFRARKGGHSVTLSYNVRTRSYSRI